MKVAPFVLGAWLSGIFLVGTGSLLAQSVYGGVSGRLTTVAGQPGSGASISLTSLQTGARLRTQSDSDGYFFFNNLSPDVYQVDVVASGFQSLKQTIPVNADSTTSVDAVLQVGATNVGGSSAVEVSALKLDRTDVSTLFDSQSVAELPLFDLNLTQLQLLVPGAERGELFIPPNQNPQGGLPVNINGQHFSGSAFQLDGTENRDPLEGIAVINPPLDSVRELKVTTQGYNAEFGQATAGVITVQTKSGSNAWHGDGFGFRRTGWGQSEDPFAPAGVPPTKYDIFGGSLGGPIVTNRLFVFGDYQGTRSSQGGNVLLSVPSAHVLHTCLGSAGAPSSLCDLSQYSQFIPGSLKNPSTKLPFCPPQVGNPCNQIPNSLVTDQAVALLRLLPPANHLPTDKICGADSIADAVCNNYLASGQEVFNADQFDLRTDYNVNSRLRFFGRYSFGDFFDNGAPGFGNGVGGLGADPSGFAGLARTRNQGVSSGFTYSLGPKTLTDFRFGYFRYRLNVDAEDYGQTPSIDMPQIFAPTASDPFATGMPDFEIPGQQLGTAQGLFPGLDYLRFGYSLNANYCDCPLREHEQQFQFVNNWTRIVGQHILKFGGDLRFLQNYRVESDRPRTGYYSFAPGATGLGLATFLIGDVTTFERYWSGPSVTDAGEHQKRFGFYGQDTWRINSRLTLNYGLRWEIYFPQTLTGAGGFLIPNLNDHDPTTTYFSTPSTTDSAGGIGGNWTNFAPRLGIGYLIGSATVIRASYARSFDAGYAGDLFGIAATQNPPVTVDQNIESGGISLANSAEPPPFIIPNVSPLSLAALAASNTKAQNGLVTSGALLYALPPTLRVPTVDSWNLTVQRELTPRLYVELGYVGNKGTHVFPDNSAGTFYLLSQPHLQGLIQQTIANGTSVPNVNTNNCQSAFFTFGTVNTNSEEQYCLTIPAIRSFYNRVQGSFNPSLFKIRYFGNDANDNYNSLQAKVRKTFGRGFSMLAHYTWSRALDYDSNYFFIDPGIGYGPASFDLRHRFVMTNIWDLPFGHGRVWLAGVGSVADRFIGGWTVSAVTIWQSGLPFTPSYNSCVNDTDSGDPCRPNRVGQIVISGSRNQYFSTTGGTRLAGTNCNSSNFCGVNANGQPVPGPAMGPWQRPGAGQIGDVGRDSLTGPGFFQSDIGLAKVIPLSERAALRFRGDAFNAFNKVNLGNPDPCVDCTSGGDISSLAVGARQRTLQLSLRIEF